MQVEHRRAVSGVRPATDARAGWGCAAVRTDSGAFESPSGPHLRTTGRSERRWRGRIEPIRATEIADDEKPRIIEGYLVRWGYHVSDGDGAGLAAIMLPSAGGRSARLTGPSAILRLGSCTPFLDLHRP
jgi:hypothetical protein